MSQPVIGVTLDSEEPGGYSRLPWYALRQNYCEAVARAGGLPILLPHEPSQAEAYLERIDGLVVTGGAFDVDPALFGAATRHATVKLKTKRTAFEIEITKGALARNMPVLGICGGQQLLNVVLGGTLIQHIPDEVSDALAHEQPNPRTRWPASVRGLGCSWGSESETSSGICWIRVPPRTTFSNCWPPQMPSTGMLRASAPFAAASSKAVRRSLVVTLGCRVSAPNKAGSTSKPPPVMTSPSIPSR